MNPLERLRNAAGLTQSELAERIGVTAKAISKWENHESQPRPEQYPKLAKAFGISAMDATKLIVPEDVIPTKAQSKKNIAISNEKQAV